MKENTRTVENNVGRRDSRDGAMQGQSTGREREEGKIGHVKRQCDVLWWLHLAP